MEERKRRESRDKQGAKVEKIRGIEGGTMEGGRVKMEKQRGKGVGGGIQGWQRKSPPQAAEENRDTDSLVLCLLIYIIFFYLDV